MEGVRLDLCLLADIRAGDVAAPCHAAAAEAAAAAGYRVGVLPVAPLSIAADPFRLDEGFARLFASGRACRLAPGAAVDCTLVLAFDARLFAAGPLPGLRIGAARRLVTVERAAALASLPRTDLEGLAEAARLALGGPPVWAPTTAVAREALTFAVPDWPLTPEDWLPVAPPLSEAGRRATHRGRPAIGAARIARVRPGAALPRGAAPLPLWRLRLSPDGGRPFWPPAAPVEIWPDDRISLADFLPLVDLLANADEAADDPCPVEALLALRAGTVPYLPDGCRGTFGAAALYGGPGDVARRALDLQAEEGLALDLRAAGVEALAGRFSSEAFLARLAPLVGPPRPAPFAPAVLARPPARVLFLSTNGVGMGHLTRQLAVARRLPGRLEPVFLSHSQAVDVARSFGFPAEHLPYHAASGEARAHWNAGLAGTLGAAIAFWQPAGLVFDGNVPFAGLMAALEEAPDLARIWIRRGLWGAGRDPEALERGAAFDLILEPGEPAAALDDGPTAVRRGETRGVAPIRLLDGAEIPGRAEACAALGLDRAAVNVLIAPGSGNNFATGGLAARAVAALAGRRGIGVAVARWMISHEAPELPAGVVALTGFPFARHLAAFDFALAAAGYNSFVEHLERALPTLWTPNEHAEQDRQIVRARWAERQGLGLTLRLGEEMRLGAALDRMLDPAERAAFRAAGASTAEALAARNGAVEAAEAIAVLCGTAIARGR
ncbi:antifreeze protein [Rhodobacter sphaeroides]|uniref:antifreeze protein n=1 Tax=Cereibacter sphaeroides TaxID=1063 RepID=UPI001323EE55|nr:antifreeze protein [Cereibacter sphaeroides]MWP37920.1 antifreeze protein [Cereibacter sphaeroides]